MDEMELHEHGGESCDLNDRVHGISCRYSNKTSKQIYHTFLKDCLPYLFHGFRNKYFNNISLDSMLYFQNELYKF